MDCKKMPSSTTLSSKFQISIPKDVREDQRWKVGQKFAFIPKDGGVMLVPVPTWDELRGIAKGANPDNYRDRNDRY
jgi:AbrB family looped-hinge helix DNA binding protein